MDVACYPHHWQPIVDAAAAIRNGDVSAASRRRPGLDYLRGSGWDRLADALTEIADGGTAETDTLDGTERAVIECVPLTFSECGTGLNGASLSS